MCALLVTCCCWLASWAPNSVRKLGVQCVEWLEDPGALHVLTGDFLRVWAHGSGMPSMLHMLAGAVRRHGVHGSP